MEAVTERLAKPIPSIKDMFVTVSLSGSLMSDELRRKLNPLVIKVHAATNMPDTPLSYADLRLKWVQDSGKKMVGIVCFGDEVCF